MHWLIPFAAPLSEAGRAALRELRLPRLQALLAGCVGALDAGDEYSLSPPHERALARAWGWAGGGGEPPDGQLPFAARQALADGIAPGGLAWGLLTPAHWHVGGDQTRMLDPAALGLEAGESRAFFDALAELFTSEGFALRWGAPERWYLAHESLAGLPTASLDRVIGRNVDPWLRATGSGDGARLLRRLQNEAQMLLYTHPLNDAREARGLPTLNSLWLSACGALPPEPAGAGAALRVDPRVEDRLRQPALAEDWAGWARAWALIDEELAQRQPARITLCGERAALDFVVPAPTAWRRFKARFAPRDLLQRMEAL
jgi:hypothetical protein